MSLQENIAVIKALDSEVIKLVKQEAAMEEIEQADSKRKSWKVTMDPGQNPTAGLFSGLIVAGAACSNRVH